MERHYELIRDELYPLHERMAEKLNHAGLGEFRISRAEDQINLNGEPLGLEGIVRIEREGEGDWSRFWTLTADAEYLLTRYKNEEPEVDPEVHLDAAVLYVIQSAIEMQGRAESMKNSRHEY